MAISCIPCICMYIYNAELNIKFFVAGCVRLCGGCVYCLMLVVFVCNFLHSFLLLHSVTRYPIYHLSYTLVNDVVCKAGWWHAYIVG